MVQARHLALELKIGQIISRQLNLVHLVLFNTVSKKTLKDAHVECKELVSSAGSGFTGLCKAQHCQRSELFDL